MITVTLRFYEELNDFLPAPNRKSLVVRTLTRPTSVKDLIESCGVPHTEVDLILVNSESQGFHYLVADGDSISIYPVFESFDISGSTRLQERPLRHLHFVADRHLGKLVRKLRVLGFDVAFDAQATHDDLIQRMLNENRVILSTDRRLLMRKVVVRGYCIRSNDTGQQVLEVVRRFDLIDAIQLLSRCAACNGLIKAVSKESVEEYLEPRTRKYYSAFTQCVHCKKIYWQGSHTLELASFIEWLRKAVQQQDR
ncbi:MAG TPA: Mut7-C RNAse domain-containing protein [Thermodesulfobacteriota bacterium]|mgnify:CR=1 FL=1|nr:Mut7-C ubiquitin/RNAse domain-containing protein [Deltaproteobacteria bacterium]HNR12200.1 Mut7-C RNAse domain-containing protein [Thermodesulfobacteriota bacterium]HNU71273.1 Mut7-C RNAse domain-containing protein [Thermodesulfobacteriota bacterium]HOC38373.1 Mut7-C RNAse domain-containing protein [Thermodesulfobacteriota bacterium]HQO77545.1 Mut7-C RNAse domain-containing protein [Thermodesulfobacteriota bacterium]